MSPRISAAHARAVRINGRLGGRPRVYAVNLSRVTRLRQLGYSWVAIGKDLGIPWRTVYRRYKQEEQKR